MTAALHTATITNPALVRDLLEWIDARPRTYAETLDAWRTSCPRLPVWEDAVDCGLVARVASDGRVLVVVTDAGRVWVGDVRRNAGAMPLGSGQ